MAHREFNMQKYWEWRAQTFGEIEWASSTLLRSCIANKLEAHNVNVVADLGCGVGIQSRVLAGRGYEVIGVDNSPEMIRLAKQETPSAIDYRVEDVRKTGIADASVDAVILCMLLHNVHPDWTCVLMECARILRDRGVLVVAEGMPPSPKCSQFFETVLSRVHPRHFFSRETLIEQIEQTGFEIQAKDDVIITGMSIKSWLQKSVVDARQRARLLVDHQNMPIQCRRYYNYKRRNDDTLIDGCFFVIEGKLFKRRN